MQNEKMQNVRMLSNLILVAILAISVSCVQRKNKAEKPKETIKVVDSKHGQITIQEPAVQNEDVVTATSLEEKEVLKIGVLIGPGGARTWAAIGVLKEFERANIPVEVIGGMEWGSFIAALFSQKGKTNDTEWRASKIEDNAFKKGLLSSQFEAKDLKDFQKDLKTIFEDQRAENSKVKFLCGSDSFRLGKSSILNKGAFTDVMNYCLSYPPLLETYKGWNASSLRVKPYVDALKNSGANYLILIDVIQGGEPFNSQKVSSESSILWMEVQRALKSENKLFHQVIEVRLNSPITDFKSRKANILDGEKMGRQAVQTLKDHL